MAKRTVNLDTKEIALILEWIPSDSVYEPFRKKMQNQLKTIKVSSRKAKGRDLQKWMCSEISEIVGIPYKQDDDQCLIHSREMSQAGTDIVLRGEAFKLFPYSVECKNTESLDLVKTVVQAKSNTVDSTDYLIVHKRKALPEVVVVMAWDAFKKLVRR